MKCIIILLALVVVGWSEANAVPSLTNSASANRILVVDRSSTWISMGKATLTIGTLQRANGVYSGNYKITLFPYFFKNEKGRLAIIVSDKSLAEVNQGKTVAITGTATANGKDGKSRHIDITATPVDINHGTLKLWFTAGDTKMIFKPAYHFAGKMTAVALAQTTETKP